MEGFVSKNIREIEVSGIRKFYNEVLKVPGAISLTLGEPDFEVPKEIKESMIYAIHENKTRYTSNNGIIELRREISKYLNSMDIIYNEEEICVTVGGSEALNSTFLTLIEKGDKVLIPSPAYPAYESCVKIAGGEVVNYHLKEDFSIDIDNLKEIIEVEKPKILVLSFPTNPTGAILDKKTKEDLYELVKDKNIIILSDEIYASIYYENEYFSLAQYEDIKEKVIIIGGFSKMFSMTGLRVGFICAHENLMKHIIKVHQYGVSSATSIAQWGAYAGLKSSMYNVKLMTEKFRERRDFLCSRLNHMGLDVITPKGAFYVFPSIKKYSNNSFEFCKLLLEEEKVAIIPGVAFGDKGEGHVRISYSYSIEELTNALNRIEKFLAKQSI